MDEQGEPTYIETIPKKGYRLLAPVVGFDDGTVIRKFDAETGSGQMQILDSPTGTPSIAVLPFSNMSSGASQDFFSEGLTEDITTELTLIPGLRVVARTSSSKYQGNVEITKVGIELGVDYVLEGSVRKSGSQIRITAQLLETNNGYHLWAKRYDRNLEDMFELQDELTKEIVTALDVKLVSGERGRHHRSRFKSFDSGEALYRGMAQFNTFTETGNAQAKMYFEQLIEMEPTSILGYVQMMRVCQQELVMGWSADEASSIKRMGGFANKSLSIDGKDPEALGFAGMVELLRGNHDEAIAYAEAALVEAPEMDAPYYTLGWYQMFNEQPLEAIQNLKRSIRLTPYVSSPRASMLGTCYRNSNQMELALAILEDAVLRDPTFIFARVVLTSCNAVMGERLAAEKQVREILRRDPNYSVTRYTTPNLYRYKDSLKKWAGALRSVGLPD